MSENEKILIENPHRLLTPGSVLLVSVGDKNDDNLFSVAWNMALRKQPPMVAIQCGKGHYSYKLMRKTGEFGINIPDQTLIDEVMGCGKTSGRDIADKFSYFQLNRLKAESIKAPLIAEAVANLECRISHIHDMGASSLIIAQILRAIVEKKHYRNDKWNFDNGLQLIHHLGGSEFCVSEKLIKSNWQ